MDNSSNIESDIEVELQNLERFDNEKQLKLLKREVYHIITHGLIPYDKWYNIRFKHIVIYSKLDWYGLVKRFEHKDPYMFNTAIVIVDTIIQLIEDRSINKSFDIQKYSSLLDNIDALWSHYKNEYIGEETDLGVMDLITGMKFL